MVYRILISILIALVLSTTCVLAGGSIFSPGGVGEQLVGGGARAIGLGGGGYALGDSMSFNSDNPALVGFVTRTSIRMGGQYAYWQTNAGNQKDSDSEVLWKDFRMFFKVTPKWKLGIGADPIRRVDIQTFDQRTAFFTATDSVQYERRVFWNGSSVAVRMDNAYQVNDKFSVGAALAYSFLHNDRETSLFFKDDSSSYTDINYVETVTYRNWWLSLGAFYQFTPQLAVSGFYKWNHSGTWDYQFTKSGSDSTLKRNHSGSNPKGQFGFGVSYRMKPGLVVVADASGEFWEKNLGIMSEIDGVKPVDPMFLSVGIERLANNYTPKTVWNSWGYRAGLFFRKHYWPEIANTAIQEYGLSMGTSIPVGHGTSYLHWGAEFGKRGDKSKIGVEENFVRLNIEFEMGETWFERTKPRIPK